MMKLNRGVVENTGIHLSLRQFVLGFPSVLYDFCKGKCSTEKCQWWLFWMSVQVWGFFGGCFCFLLLILCLAVGFWFFGRGMDRSAGKSSRGYIWPKDAKCYILLMQDNLTFKNWYRNRLLKTNTGKREARETSAEVRLNSYTRN